MRRRVSPAWRVAGIPAVLLLASAIGCGAEDAGEGASVESTGGNGGAPEAGSGGSGLTDSGGPDASATPDASALPDSAELPDSVAPGADGSELPPIGGDLPDCSFDRGLPFDPAGTVLQLESADQSICVRLERRNDGAGSLANVTWTLIDIRVGPLGAVAHVDDPAALCWYSSHHNFLDWAHTWTGTVHYDLKVKLDGHDGPRTYTLYVFAQGPIDPTASCSPLADGSEPIGDPIELFPVNP
jgi:hypothetical protein